VSSIWKRERAASPAIDEAGKGGRGKGKPDGFNNQAEEDKLEAAKKASMDE